MTSSLVIRVVFWCWLLGALVVGQLRLLERLPPPAVQGILLALTGLLVLAYHLVRPFRAWADAFDLRAIVLLHVTRFVGVYFLLLYQRGELPYAFAVPGGIGDIAVALLAVLVCVYPFSESARLRAISIWNVIGLIDILLVVSSAARIGLTDGRQLAALTHLPLSLLPTFLVPLILASHVLIYHRLSRLED